MASDSAVPLIADSAGKLKGNTLVRRHFGMALARKGMNKEMAAEIKAVLASAPTFLVTEEAKKSLEGLNPDGLPGRNGLNTLELIDDFRIWWEIHGILRLSEFLTASQFT